MKPLRVFALLLTAYVAVKMLLLHIFEFRLKKNKRFNRNSGLDDSVFELEIQDIPWWERYDCNKEKVDDKSSFIKMKKTTVSGANLLTYENWKKNNAVNHTCGWKSWHSGANQKVVSYTIYGDSPEYWDGLGKLLTTANLLYPGWNVRVYTNPRKMKHILCPLILTHSNLHICDVTSLPLPLGNITDFHPKFWRFVALQDPLVDVAVIRDSDGIILTREVDAVNEWLSSNKTLHIMRDHPAHNRQILAGMWGMQINSRNRKAVSDVMHTVGIDAVESNDYSWDQIVLLKRIWPLFMNDSMGHDSYHCDTYPNTWPWPTQRHKTSFVGNRDYSKKRRPGLHTNCPVICRPPSHKDWKYC